jgi:hypothetical protein
LKWVFPVALSVTLSCASGQSESRHDSPAESREHLERALRHVIETSAPQILDCFHEGAHFSGVSIASVDVSNPVAVVEGKLVMRVLFRDFTMAIRTEVDLGRRTIRVLPGESTTPFAPDPRCALLEPRRMAAVLGPASHDAVRELESASRGRW